MKPYSKVTYQTLEGKIFKTIAPVCEMIALDYMNANYSHKIQILSIRPSLKRKYKKYCNILSH